MTLHRFTCPICLGQHAAKDSFVKNYPGMLCRTCADRAVNAPIGQAPRWQSAYDTGDNPVFVDGLAACRRYRFGGYVTMLLNPGARVDCADDDAWVHRLEILKCYERIQVPDAARGSARIWPYVGPNYFAPDAVRLLVIGVNAYFDQKDTPAPWWFSKEFERARLQDSSDVHLFNRRIGAELSSLATALAELPVHSGRRSSGLDTAYVTNAIKVFLPRDVGRAADAVPDEMFDAFDTTWRAELDILTPAPPHAIVVLGRRWWRWAWQTFADHRRRPRWATRFTSLPAGTELHHHLNLVHVSAGTGSYVMPLIELDHPSRPGRRATAKWLTSHPQFWDAIGAEH